MPWTEPSDVPFVTYRMAQTRLGNGLYPAEASIITNAFMTCPGCDAPIDTDATNGKREDRDVVWNRVTLNSTPYTCPACTQTFDLLVEEKAFGTLSREQTPDNPGDHIMLVPVRDPDTGAETDTVLCINTHQIYVTPHPTTDNCTT